MATLTLASGASMEVAQVLYDFINDEAANGTRWSADEVFRVLGELVEEFGPRNRELLEKRAEFQRQIDDYYNRRRADGWKPGNGSAEEDAADLEKFLVEIGYLAPENPLDFRMTVPQLDPEMDQNGPELVTPVTNASMAVGGANARWGSLYDAYFLSDIHPEIDRDDQRPQRLRMVVEDTNSFLDNHVAAWEPVAARGGGRDSEQVGFDDIARYSLATGPDGRQELVGHTKDGGQVRLADREKFVGYNLGRPGPTDRVLPGRQWPQAAIPALRGWQG